MANIFAILTAVVLAASAYVAYKNKEMYTVEIENRKEEQGRLKKSQERLKGLQDDRDATIEERKGVEEDTIAKQKTEADQKEKNAGLKSDIDSGRESIADNQVKIDEFKEKTKELGELSEIAGKIERMSNEIAGLEDDKANKTATLANLISEKNGTEASIDRYQDINTKVSQKKSYFSSTRITAIYGNWGFVTLGAGNSAGVVAGSRLNVVRGGETVAKLHVRSVEAGRASADIVPDSLAEDTVLMVGDKVVPSDDGEAKAQAAN